jgi:integrase
VLGRALNKRSRIASARAIELPDFRGHDLRRTAASYMASAGVPRLHIAKVLNHADSSVTAVYDRHSYDPEKRAALDTWGRKLRAIVERADVVPIAAGGAR